MNDDGLYQLAQRCDELGLVEFRSLCGNLGQAPDVGEIALTRRRCTVTISEPAAICASSALTRLRSAARSLTFGL